MNTFKELLIKLKTPYEFMVWVENKTWNEVFETCHRGDWLLWLFKKTMINDEDNLRKLTLVKAHCASNFRKLMKDQRSLNALDVAIKFGNNEATIEELKNAAITANAAYAFNSNYITYAAYGATAIYNDGSYGYAYIKRQDQLEIANICRKYLPIEVWNIHIE